MPVSKVLSALADLTLYEEQQVDDDVGILRGWKVYRRTVKGRQLRGHVVQTTIDSFPSLNAYYLVENLVIGCLGF